MQHTQGLWKFDGKAVWAPHGEGENIARDVAKVKREGDGRLIAEAPAMLAALRKISQGADCFTFNSDADAFRFVDMVAEAVAPIIARIDGAAPAPTAPAPIAAPGFAAHALDTLKDCEAWFANGGDVDGVFFDDATMLDRVRESLALATPTAQPAGAIGEAGGDEPQKPVCRSCGGDSVVIDGAARWNMAGQDWGLSGTYDDSAYCDDCEEETKLNWVAVAPDAAATEGEA